MKTRIIEGEEFSWPDRSTERYCTVRERYFHEGRPAGLASSGDGTGYTEGLLNIMDVKPEWTVLDMACADGALAIALAERVKHVTAVDFSENMLEILKDRLIAKSIRNVKPIHGQWEDDWTGLGIGMHDVAVASRSVRADDLLDTVLKLNSFAKKRVYLSTAVGDGPFDRAIYEATGRTLNMGPSYTYVYYNLIYRRMGILANIAFVRESRENEWSSFEEALDSQKWMFGNLTMEEDEKLRRHLDRTLTEADGRWRLPYERECRWAVMSWEKE